jgi:hypothetical protein
MLASERHYVTTPALLDAFLTRFKERTEPPPEPADVPVDCSPAPASVEEPPADSVDDEPPVAVSPPPVVSAAETIPVPAPPAGEGVRVRITRALGDWSTKVLAALAIALLIESLVIIWLWNSSSEALVRSGELVVQSRPTGATVTLDDKDLGTTPVTVRVSPGTYTLKVQVGTGEPRVIPVQIRAGVQTVQYLELQNVR